MSIANIGSVSVTVVPDAGGFREKLAADLRDLTVAIKVDTAGATAHLDELTARLDRLGAKSPKVNVGVNTGKASADIGALLGEVAALEVVLGLLDAETAVGAETFDLLDSAMADLIVEGALLEAELAGLLPTIAGVDAEMAAMLGEMAALPADFGAAAGASTGLDLSLKSLWSSVTGLAAFAIPALIGVAIALSPALIPIGAALLVVAGGLTAVTLAATAGIGVFALAIIPQLQNAIKGYQALQKAQQNVANAPTVKKHTAALLALKHLTDAMPAGQAALLGSISQIATAFSVFSAAVLKVGAPALTAGVKALSAFLTGITPLASAAAPALTAIGNSLAAAFSSKGFAAFISALGTISGQAITGFATIIGQIATGIGSLVLALGPTGQAILNDIGNFLKGSGSWGTSAGFQNFLKYARDNGPAVGKFLGDLWTLLKNVGGFLAKVGPPTLALLDHITTFINQSILPALDHAWASFARGIAQTVEEFKFFGDFVLSVIGGILHGFVDVLKLLPFSDKKALDAAAANFDELKSNFDHTTQGIINDFNGIADAANGLPGVKSPIDINVHLGYTGSLPSFLVPTGGLGVLQLAPSNPHQSKSNNSKTGTFTGASGGPVLGNGISTQDSIRALLAPGEFVQQASAVNRYGLDMMHAINDGSYRGGGNTVIINNPPEPTVEAQLLAALRKRDALYPVG